MKNICHLLSNKGFDVICPNLLNNDTSFDYSHEKAAYLHFMDNIGFKKASDIIKRLLLDMKDKYKKVYLIGFSVGATVAWLCSEEESLDGIVGYYGSRIRNYLEIDPHCPTMLVFPQKERSFHVDELISCFEEKKKVEILKFNGLHGFSDPYSPNYHVKSAQEAFSKVIDFIKRH